MNPPVMTTPLGENGTIKPEHLRDSLQQVNLMGTGNAECLIDYIEGWGLAVDCIPSLRAAANAFLLAEQHMQDACRIAEAIARKAN